MYRVWSLYHSSQGPRVGWWAGKNEGCRYEDKDRNLSQSANNKEFIQYTLVQNTKYSLHSFSFFVCFAFSFLFVCFCFWMGFVFVLFILFCFFLCSLFYFFLSLSRSLEGGRVSITLSSVSSFSFHVGLRLDALTRCCPSTRQRSLRTERG